MAKFHIGKTRTTAICGTHSWDIHRFVSAANFAKIYPQSSLCRRCRKIRDDLARVEAEFRNQGTRNE